VRALKKVRRIASIGRNRDEYLSLRRDAAGPLNHNEQLMVAAMRTATAILVVILPSRIGSRI
jgi:hypothetical protein